MTAQPSFFVSWHDEYGQQSKERLDLVSCSSGSKQNALELELYHNDACWHLEIKVNRRVWIDEISAILPCNLKTADAIYLNGYNSWTDSKERSPKDRMRNFGVPRWVINHWVLDGSGDYRFTPSDERCGYQHGFSYAYLRMGDEIELVGSLSEDDGFTTIFEDLPNSSLRLSKETPATCIEAGTSRKLMSFCVLQGAQKDVIASWLTLSGIHARPCMPLVGYTSWYRHYTDINEKKILHDLEGVCTQLFRFDIAGCVPVFQIDDGYTKVGDWLSPDKEKFPFGLRPITKEICQRGLLPGLWLAPFVCERDSKLFSEHPEWLLRDSDGCLVSTGSHWSGQVALDTRNEEFRRHISRVLHTIAHEWGFALLKCDFLYAACMLPHDGLNRGELMADALDLIRQSVGQKIWLDYCGVPLSSAFGRSEFCRVGCDVGLDWDDKPFMRLTGRERVSCKNNLANTIGRAHLDGLAFRCDPDVFFLRKDVKLSDSQRRSLLMADARCGGVFFSSDDMSQWDDGQLQDYRVALSQFVSRAQERGEHDG